MKKVLRRKLLSIKKIFLERSILGIVILVGILLLSSSAAAYTILANKTPSNPAKTKTTDKIKTKLTDSEQPSKTNKDSANPSSASQANNNSSSNEPQKANSSSQTKNTPTASNRNATTTAPSNSGTASSNSPAEEPYPAYAFYVTPGPMVRTDGASTITYTVNVTIQPHYAKFGNPTITIGLAQSLSPPCNNKGENITRRYNGNNSLSISCIVNRVFPSQPPNYIAPLPSGSYFTIGVHGNLDSGQFIYGGSNMVYQLNSGYDR